jgi:nitrate/nitrite transport system ATP-binding protein
MTTGPAAKVGEILNIDLPRPRDRLALADNPNYNHYRAAVLTFLHQKQAKKPASAPQLASAEPLSEVKKAVGA